MCGYSHWSCPGNEDSKSVNFVLSTYDIGDCEFGVGSICAVWRIFTRASMDHLPEEGIVVGLNEDAGLFFGSFPRPTLIPVHLPYYENETQICNNCDWEYISESHMDCIL